MANSTIFAMDIGNTNIHWGFITNGEIENYNRCNHTELSKLPWDEIRSRGCPLVIASVFPYINNIVQMFAEENQIKYIELTLETQKAINNTYPTLGVDRVCDLAAGMQLFPENKSPIITFNFGTATTITSCTSEGEFLGGVIRTGFELELKSMTSNTLSLPHVQLERECKINKVNPICKDTENAILHGVILGQVALVESYIKTFKEQVDSSPKVVLTGGNASIISKYFNNYDACDSELTLRGVYHCYTSMLVTA